MGSVAQQAAWGARAELNLATGDIAKAHGIVERLMVSIPNASSEKTVIPRLWNLRGQVLSALGRTKEAEVVFSAAQETAEVQGLSHTMAYSSQLGKTTQISRQTRRSKIALCCRP